VNGIAPLRETSYEEQLKQKGARGGIGKAANAKPVDDEDQATAATTTSRSASISKSVTWAGGR
jgi:hypothetical protein